VATRRVRRLTDVDYRATTGSSPDTSLMKAVGLDGIMPSCMELDDVLHDVVTMRESNAIMLTFKTVGSCPVAYSIWLGEARPCDPSWPSSVKDITSIVGDVKLGRPSSAQE
jgi:hypothetical protein